jgi:hypothetical protein
LGISKLPKIVVTRESEEPIFYQHLYPDGRRTEGLLTMKIQGDDFIILRLETGEEIAVDFGSFMENVIKLREEIVVDTLRYQALSKKPGEKEL